MAQMSDPGDGVGECTGRSVVISQDLPACRPGQSVFDPSTDRAVDGVEVLLALRQFGAITGCAGRRDHLEARCAGLPGRLPSRPNVAENSWGVAEAGLDWCRPVSPGVAC
ncbi:hypothetical protein GCM10012275_59290 [Longimycelium tulufanense]|uniref:Uncharacterized protein n=1 Tax=Longimycelium tulufanense TaxID=907463 RepID=A0A8J3CE09_9PSEU|nr:hypothetical protein GCM10012275_59290 [Longimycelium tulufanense]